MNRFSGLWFVVTMLASVSLPASASRGGEKAGARRGQESGRAVERAPKGRGLALVVREMDPRNVLHQGRRADDSNGWDDNFLWFNPRSGLALVQPGAHQRNGLHAVRGDFRSRRLGDNYLCAPQDYGFKWSMKGTIKGMQCLQVNEPSDQHTWHDNFLCWPPAGAGRSMPWSVPPERNRRHQPGQGETQL